MVRKKAVERPDPTPFTRDDLMMPTQLSMWGFFQWRQNLKYYLAGRDRHCRSCGRPFNDIPKPGGRIPIHMHEGIFSRNLVTGWPKRWRILIHAETNCVLLCSDCNMSEHGKHPPAPADVWREHCEMYGTDTMLEWYDSLPFKQTPAFVNRTRQMLAHKEL